MSLNICQSDLYTLAPADLDRVLRDIRVFGFQRVRWEVPFHVVYKTAKPDWSAVARVLDALDRAGLGHLPVLGAHRQPMGWAPTAATYADFCYEFVGRMNNYPLAGNGVREVELWNEPNLIQFWPKADPATFVTWAIAGYRAIKQHSIFGRKTTVILGGLAATETSLTGFWKFLRPAIGYNRKGSEFLADALGAAGGVPFFDRVGYHPYSFDKSGRLVRPTATVPGIADRVAIDTLVDEVAMQAAIDAKSTSYTPYDWVTYTEFGFRGKGTQSQVDWLKAQMLLLDTGRTDLWLFNWRDATGENFGLVDVNNVPKRPYYDYVRSLL